MIAGTIALLDAPPGEALSSWQGSGGLPALDVRNTQRDLDGDAIAQHGMAAGRVSTSIEEVHLGDDGTVYTTREDVPETVATEWVADVTGAGVVIAERVRGSGAFPFPFDLFTSLTNTATERVVIDLDAVSGGWAGDGLRDTWLVGSRDFDGTDMRYGDRADPGRAAEANLGLGFELSWEGTVARGVVYDSGYVAIYSAWTHAVFVQFVTEELLPHASVPEEDDGGQQTL